MHHHTGEMVDAPVARHPDMHVMPAGGPLKATLTTADLDYKEAFGNFEMGYACAIAFVLAAIIFLCTVVQRRFMEE